MADVSASEAEGENVGEGGAASGGGSVTGTAGTSSTVRVRHFGGLGVIGGSKILIETDHARILFDIGLDSALDDTAPDLFAREEERRGDRELADRLRMGVAPRVSGLFNPRLPGLREEFAAGAGSSAGAVGSLTPSVEDTDDPRGPLTVFLSHAHIDHDGLMGWVRPGLRVYTHPETIRVERALAEAGLVAPIRVDLQPIEPGKPVRVGDLDIECVRVDHDVPGASGYLVHSPAGLIAYTGDINVHRHGGVHTLDFARRVHGCRLLITETTGLSFIDAPLPESATGPIGDSEEFPPGPPTEDELAARLAEHLRSASGLQLVSAYVRDAERMELVRSVAAQYGRTLVLPSAEAAALDSLGVEDLATWRADVPQLEVHRRAARRLRGDRVRAVSLAEVREHPEAFLVELDSKDPATLLDLPIGPGTAWIHSQGEPLGPFMPDWQPFMDWLGALGVETVGIGSSGHASAAQLQRLITSIEAREVHAIHGTHPEWLRVPGSEVVAPEAGRTYVITS